MGYQYSHREVLVDGVVHIIGLTAAVAASAVLIGFVMQTQDIPVRMAVIVYVCLLIIALVASALYHLLPWEGPRPLLHRIDHAAIYLKIAGTYTPLVVILGSVFSYSILSGVWIVAVAGAIAKLSFWRTDARGSLALYLAMGWAAVLLIWPMWTTLPGIAVVLIVAGGGLYTLGTVFFAMRALRYQNAIWHGFVLAASTCFFCAITVAVTAQA